MGRGEGWEERASAIKSSESLPEMRSFEWNRTSVSPDFLTRFIPSIPRARAQKGREGVFHGVLYYLSDAKYHGAVIKRMEPLRHVSRSRSIS